MHADEAAIDAALLRRLLRDQFPQWAELPLEPVLPMGTDNALYRLGDELVVRLPRRERTRITLEKERRWLPTLAPLLSHAVPIPLADGLPGDGFPFSWFVYTWLEGETATPERVRDPEELATDLADFLGSLQRIDPRRGPAPGTHNFYRGIPLAQRDAVTRAWIRTLESRIDTDAVTAAWDQALRVPEWHGPRVWIHGDLDGRNILVQNGRLHAVIDWGGLAVGDPAYDVMVAWKVLPTEARSTFRAALDIDDATWARSRGGTLSQALGALAYYTLETNAVLVRESERWLAAVLTDPV